MGRWCRPFSLHQLHQAGEAHGFRESRRVMEANGVAERWQQTPGEELDPLRLLETTGAG
jgi:hypothetical protein